MTFALNSSLSRRVTVTSSAFSTTWLFVRMKPSGETMNPEPSDFRFCSRGMRPK